VWQAGLQTMRVRGVCERALQPLQAWEGGQHDTMIANRTRENRPSGMIWGAYGNVDIIGYCARRNSIPTICLLDHRPGMGDRVTTGPGVVLGLPPGGEPTRDTTNSGSTHGIGARATREGPREGQEGSRRGAEYQGRWGSVAQATHGREGAVEQRIRWRDRGERLCAH